VRFEPGRAITRRYVRGPWCSWVQAMRVVSDNDDGLLLWQSHGSDFAALVDADGSDPHEVPLDQMREPRLTRSHWRNDVLILMPPAAAYSVWWFFREGVFTGWYVNLETPYVRRPDGVDATDLVLDIVVQPDRRWQWKDVDEFEQRIGHPLYFDRAAADGVREQGLDLVKLIEAGAYPFDGTHADFSPDPRWPPLRLDPSNLAAHRS
jgi:hypothetical protein